MYIILVNVPVSQPQSSRLASVVHSSRRVFSPHSRLPNNTRINKMYFQEIISVCILLVIIRSCYSLQCYECAWYETVNTCDEEFWKLENCDSVLLKEHALTNQRIINSSIGGSMSSALRTQLENANMTPTCATIVLSVSGSDEADYTRICVPKEFAEQVCNKSKSLYQFQKRGPFSEIDVDIKCDFCDKDACNSANMTKITFIIVILCIMVSKLISKY